MAELLGADAYPKGRVTHIVKEIVPAHERTITIRKTGKSWTYQVPEETVVWCGAEALRFWARFPLEGRGRRRCPKCVKLAGLA